MVKEEKKLDWLGERVIDALRENGIAEGHVETWRLKLLPMDRLSIFRQVSNLDINNQRSLAAAIGCSVRDLKIALEVIKRI
jgi:hypothetical protein